MRSFAYSNDVNHITAKIASLAINLHGKAPSEA